MSSCSDDEGATIVFDIGSHCARAGFAGDDAPSVDMKYLDCPEFKEKYFDQRYKLYYPDDKCNIDVLDEVISKCIGSLNLSTSNNSEGHLLKDNGILLTENLQGCTSKREKLAELLFEKYEVASLYIAPSPVLSLYSSGRKSGIVVESGNSVTQTAVISEGVIFANSVFRKDGAGDEITDNLRNYCRKEKVNYIFSDSDYVHLKEKYSSCFEAPGTKFELPDGTTHSIKNTYLSDCTEYFSTETLPNMVYESIMASNIETRKYLFSNIILSGGNTMINGLPEKFGNRLDEIAGKHHKDLDIKVVASPERLYSPWIGGSIVGSLSCFMGKVLSRKMYQELGPKAIHERCINPVDSIQS